MSFFAAFIRRQFISWPPLPAADVSFKGKTAIITGSSGGLGAEAARWLVKLGAAKVIIAVRNTNKAGAIIKDIIATTSCPPSTLEAWALDMSSYESVQAFAERAKKLPRLDALLSNAGVAIRFNFNKTELDEETITTNVVSMALLSFLLHPKLKETAVRFNTQTHLTITGSELYEVAEFKERNVPTGQIFTTLATKEKSKLTDRYNVSKLLDLFVLRDMAAISPASSSGVIINVVAPGYVYLRRNPPPSLCYVLKSG
jgi:NAD(P)-dependent dehydrogenase (short-subunit alcohol dehydrogenase family)